MMSHIEILAECMYCTAGAGEYATNLIIANIKTMSHDDGNSHSFSSDGHEFAGGRGHDPLVPSGSATESTIDRSRTCSTKQSRNLASAESDSARIA